MTDLVVIDDHQWIIDGLCFKTEKFRSEDAERLCITTFLCEMSDEIERGHVRMNVSFLVVFWWDE